MNKQQVVKKGVLRRGIEWTDYTSNPMGGCFHACRWRMPDDTIAVCYAEETAEGVAQAAYPHGFEHYYWNPKEMDSWKSLKPGTKVFVGSMADCFGKWVPDEHIQIMIDRMRELPDVIFQLLTKNPVKAVNFSFPPNVWLGASTPPNWFMHPEPEDELRLNQREALFKVTLKALTEIRSKGTTVWISAEPLTIDAGVLMELSHTLVDWVVIGAASKGKQYFAPEEDWVIRLAGYCAEHSVAMFYKGNMVVSPFAMKRWKEEYPLYLLPYQTKDLPFGVAGLDPGVML